jgi:hypothetical protein
MRNSKRPWSAAPWRIHSVGGSPVLVNVHGNRITYLDEMSDGNKAVMAAAPELAEALLPFAALLQEHNKQGSDAQPIFQINDAQITRGDLRRAVDLLTRLTGEA